MFFRLVSGIMAAKPHSFLHHCCGLLFLWLCGLRHISDQAFSETSHSLIRPRGAESAHPYNGASCNLCTQAAALHHQCTLAHCVHSDLPFCPILCCCAGLQQMQSLHLGWCFALTDSDLQHVSHLSRLTSLVLSHTKVGKSI